VEADTYMQNRTNTGLTIDGKKVSPEDAFMGKTPSIDHICVWGELGVATWMRSSYPLFV
jgi:hypothetical protein